MAKILIVEDDDFLREGLTELLKKEGYAVQSAACLSAALEALAQAAFDLMLLDVMLPDGSGLSFCEALRGAGKGLPILFITAFDTEEDIVRGLDAGADDYVTKPFKLRELLSRVRALLRRGSRCVAAAALPKDVVLTPTEQQIYAVLTENSGLIVTRAQLLERVWDIDGSFIDDNTLSVHISRLREKIGASKIATVRGVGYRWEETV